MSVRVGLALGLLCACVLGCRGGSDETASATRVPAVAEVAPPLPDDDAGRVVARAIAAAGGWSTWKKHRDVGWISTLTVFDPFAHAISETIFRQRMTLHDGVKVRLDSIGLIDEVMFGFDGASAWMLHDGRPVDDPERMEFTRFHALSSAYWFSLPFVLAELPGELTYLGSEMAGETKLEKIRVGYADSVPVPFDWLILYFDANGRLEKVHVHALAEFLQHSLWLGVWRGDRPVDGITVSRQHAFFPADPAGEIVGAMAAEQLIEHVEFDRGLPVDLFARPEKASGLTAELES